MLSININDSDLLTLQLQETLSSLGDTIVSKVNMAPLSFNVNIANILEQILIVCVLVYGTKVESSFWQV